MTPDSSIHEALKGLDRVLWRDTTVAGVQWYYAEEGVYILRCNHGEPNEHLRVIWAKSAAAAIARAASDLHKPDEKKNSAPVRNCDVGTVEEQERRFLEYCRKYREKQAGMCLACPLLGLIRSGICGLAWAQMPYEAEQKGEKDE